MSKKINGENSMSKLYFTLTGTKYYHGQDFLEKDMQIKLIKEPDNEHDKEAIKAVLEPLDMWRTVHIQFWGTA